MKNWTPWKLKYKFICNWQYIVLEDDYKGRAYQFYIFKGKIFRQGKFKAVYNMYICILL